MANASASIVGSTSNVDINFDIDTIDFAQWIGGFVGFAESTDVTNSTSTGTVTIGTTTMSANSIGGFVGIMGTASSVSTSSTTSPVSVGNGADIQSIAGFAGETDASDISNSQSSGAVNIGTTTTNALYIAGFVGNVVNTSSINGSASSGNVQVGGGDLLSDLGTFVGYLNSSEVSKSSSIGDLTVGSSTNATTGQGNFGFIGFADGTSVVTNSYNRGNITAQLSDAIDFPIAGLVGRANSLVSITNSFSTAAISTPNDSSENPNKGGFAGLVETGATFSSNYWDTQTSGLVVSAGGVGAMGKTTAQMKTQSTFVGWDFINVWGIRADINDGYPSFNPVVVTSSQNNQTSSSSSSSSGPAACTDLPPLEVPNAFQTNAIDTKFAVFFVPLGSRVSGYVITFGTNPDNFEHAATFGHAPEGVNKAIINDLAPNTTYYYKIRAQNGCMPGDWSGVHKFTTTKNSKTVQVTYGDGKIKLFRKR